MAIAVIHRPIGGLPESTERFDVSSPFQGCQLSYFLALDTASQPALWTGILSVIDYSNDRGK